MENLPVPNTVDVMRQVSATFEWATELGRNLKEKDPNQDIQDLVDAMMVLFDRFFPDTDPHVIICAFNCSTKTAQLIVDPDFQPDPKVLTELITQTTNLLYEFGFTSDWTVAHVVLPIDDRSYWEGSEE